MAERNSVTTPCEMKNHIHHLANGDFAVVLQGTPMKQDVTRYVLVLALDLASGYAVGLTKKKGPSFLLNKMTFPGGKIDGNELPQVAAKRELSEEAGIDVPLDSLMLVSHDTGEGYELHTFVCLSEKVLCARQMEDEPVWTMDIKFHLKNSASQPECYAPDFNSKLKAALAIVCPGYLATGQLLPA